MSEFNLRQEANQAPTTCRFCGSHEGPFIDTNTDDDVSGHIWICAPIELKRAGCAGMIAVELGWVDPREAQEMRNHINELDYKLSERDSQNTYLSIPWAVASPYITTYSGSGYEVNTMTTSTLLEEPEKKPRKRRLRPVEEDED